MKKKLPLLLSLVFLVGCNVNLAANSSSNNNISDNNSIETSSNGNNNTSSTNNSINKTDKGAIYNEQDLLNIKNDLSGTYYLANDITLSSKWTTIGDMENPFTGIIDGKNYSIKNLSINSNLTVTKKVKTNGTDYDSVGGLIGYLTGTIKNLKIENYNIKIENQTPSISNVNAQTMEYKIFVGGLVGMNEGTIINCHSNGTIDVNSTHVIARARLGGLVGKNDSLIENSSSSGTINSKFYTENIRAGGLVGACEGGTINKSYSSANVNITNTTGKSIAGGLVGLVEYSSINNCYATGEVIADSNKAATSGGLIGLVDALIEGTTKVENSYSSSNVKANATVKSSYAGGLIGNCEVLINGTLGLIGDVTISNCFYAGKSIVSTAVNKAHGGAIISCIEGNSKEFSITIEDCYYLNEFTSTINGKTESKENTQGEIALSISDLNLIVNFDKSIWNISNDQLPTFK